MSSNLIVALRILHILAGAVWVGGLVIFTFYIMPSIMSAGPAGRQVMGELGKRKYPVFIMSMMGINVLAGFALMYGVSAGNPQYWQTPLGRTISFGAGLAILASIIGVAVPRPTANKLVALGETIAKSGGQPTPEQAAEMAKLQARMLMATRVVAFMLLLAVAAMAGARYMGG